MAASRFQRYLLPGLALKAVIIGGGYATGRELAEFFLPSGPRGGIAGLLLAMTVWSVVCALTFMYAQAARTFDYRSFFGNLCGRFWVLFEAAYLVFLVLILAVIGAAAGELVAVATGLPKFTGALGLTVAIGAVTMFGSRSVERLFKWASLFLYAVYVLFFVFSIGSFGERILAGFAAPVPTTGWVEGGLTYASYNIVAAVVILPVARHFTGRRDAAIAGLLAGPLAILPALLFFACMVAWYPQVGAESLPSDFLLRKLDLPAFHLVFQLMILAALLETGVGAVHAINERIAVAWQARRGVPLPGRSRLAIAVVLLVGSIFLASGFGLVALIAQGYRGLAWLILLVYILPLLTIGAWKLWHRRAAAASIPLSGSR